MILEMLSIPNKLTLHILIHIIHVAWVSFFPLQSLNMFSCIILGGFVAEHLVFGSSEGLHSEVAKVRLDSLLLFCNYATA